MPLVLAALLIHTRLSDVASMSLNSCYTTRGHALRAGRIEAPQPHRQQRLARANVGDGYSALVTLADAIQLSGIGGSGGRGMFSQPSRKLGIFWVPGSNLAWYVPDVRTIQVWMTVLLAAMCLAAIVMVLRDGNW